MTPNYFPALDTESKRYSRQSFSMSRGMAVGLLQLKVPEKEVRDWATKGKTCVPHLYRKEIKYLRQIPDKA